MRCSRRVAIGMLLLNALFAGCAVREETSLMGEPSKLSLRQARSLLQQSTEPVARTIAYVHLSDILIRNAHSKTPRDDSEERNWLDQYEEAILSARETITTSGRDAQRHPEGFKELEIVLRRHIRWLSDWRMGMVDPERAEIEETMRTATAIRGEMLWLLFPVVIQNPR